MVLHKKNFYRPIHNKGRKGYNVGIYPFTIRAKESYVFTTKLVELSRLAFSRPLKKGLRPKYKVGIYPYVSITKKPLQARMGKGKGKPSGFLAPIRIGETLLQLNQALHLNALKKLHKKVSFKLPIFTKFVIKTRTKKPFNVHREFHQAYTFLSKS
jgi:large subunit ribosomal protein L16